MTQLPQTQYRQDYQSPDFTITDIHLTFELDAHTTTVTAVSQLVRLNATSCPLVLDGEALELRTVLVDGEVWRDIKQMPGQLIIEQLPARCTLTIVNVIHPDENSALEGLYLSGGALCTQCEAQGFRRITYFLDRPDVLARYTTRVIGKADSYPLLLSNGNRIEQGMLSDGRHFVVWQDPFPKPSYLFALVAGDFDCLTDHFITASGRTVTLELYVDRGNLNRAGWAMTSLKNAMRWDEQRFGLEYDLDIYMVVAVDFFNMGAMENKGLNVFNSKYVLANHETATDQDYLNIESVIGHEYFHNWTGNRVTCRDWFQLSLKEGLTVFRDQEFSSDMGSRAVNRIEAVRRLRSAQFAEDASPMAHPIRPDKVIEMNNFYTLTVYEKGAEVIRMLHTLLGETGFQAGMKLYFSRFDGQAVTCDDFVQAMQDASGVELSLFRRWYSQSGTPILTVRDSYSPQEQTYTLHIHQHTPPTADQAEKLPLHIPFDIELYDRQGKVIPLIVKGQPIHSVLNVTAAEQTFVFEQVPEIPTPSLLREFSAPVKLDYPYEDEQLVFLMQHARNDFSRWDAAQILIAKYIRLNVEGHQHQRVFSLPLQVIDAFRAVLLDEKLDPALAAQIVTLPTENEIAEWFEVIDPDAIAAVRLSLVRCLAEELADEWLALYGVTQTIHDQIEHTVIARRALHNVCLGYLAHGEPQQANRLVEKQYRQASNMNDRLVALQAAILAQLPCCHALMSQFAETWQQDGLVMDKWFTLQATSPKPSVLQKVRELMQHPTFSMSNPNRVRSLIGAFCNGNPVAFHARDGSGYHFLDAQLRILNRTNPQVASRLIEPLIRLKRYDTERQAQMRAVLIGLQSLEGLSNDLFEKISKALA